MAETVGQHSVAAFTSPVNGTTPIDANTVRGNDNTVRSAYVDHDADPGIHVQSSSLASRPVAGTVGRKWITVSSGRYQLWYDDGSRWHEVASDAINVDCLADANLTKGDVVKITGFNNGQNLPTVNKVSASTDTAFGIVENTVTSGNLVQIVNTGLIEDVDTNGYAVGTILYPNTSGGWTTTKPTSGNYQPAGYVLRGNTNNGVLYVEFSAPRIVERSDNTASTIVLRDASGNFSAGTITAGALTSTGLVTFASLKGTGATTVTNILDEDNMASDSATALATQQSIKAYVDAKVATVDTLAEVLANGNTTGANNIIVTNGQKITTNTIDETTAAAGVTIDSVLLKDNEVKATGLLVTNLKANDGTAAGSIANSTGVVTLASSVLTTTDINGGTIDGTTIGGASAAAGTFTTVAATTGNITTVNATTVDTTNIEVTNIKAKDGTASIAIADSTGVATITAAPVLSALTASQAVFTDASKGLVSNAITGTGNVVMSASPTLTGTVTAATINATTLGGTLSTAAQPNVTSVGTLTSLTVSGNLTVDTNTLFVDSSSNRVGIGSTSAVAVGGQTNKLQIVDVGGVTGGASMFYYSADGGFNTFNFAKSRGATDGSYTIVQNNDSLGSIVFAGSDGSAFQSAASIAAQVDGTPGAGDMPGRLVFRTTADGASSPTERMRIDSSGNLAVDTNTLYVDAANNRVGVGTASPAAPLHIIGTTSDQLRLATAATEHYRIGRNASDGFLDLYGSQSGFVGYRFGGVDGTRMTLDTSGNLGLGVTPSAWTGAGRIIQFGNGSASIGTQNSGDASFMSNAYETTGSWTRVQNSLGALRYQLDINNNVHKWYTAAVGSGAITWGDPKMTLDASANLILQQPSAGGTNNLTFKASSGTTVHNIRFNDGDGSLTLGGNGSAGNFALLFNTGNTERARITSGGLFQVTADGANQTFTNSGQIALKNTGSAPYISWHESTGARIGYLQMQSTGAANLYVEASQPLVFATANTERARITSGGYFKASNTGAYNGATAAYHELRSDANATTARVQNLIASGYTDAQLQITFIGYTPNATNAWFLFCDDPTNQKAGILSTGTFESRTSTYGGVSDVKLKQDIVDAASQWDDLKAVRVRKFRFKDEPDSPLSLGVVAQELEQVSPGLVYETPDYEEQEVTDEDGNVTTEKVQVGTTKSVKYSILYMKAVKALQEAMARIEALEARLEALEA